MCLGRDRELKRGTAGHVCARPQSSAVRFDDRAADRQSHPQTARLARVEGVEDALEGGQRQPRTGIANRNQHVARGGFPRGDQQFSRAIADAAHCLDGIDDQVEHHLLQLDAIAWNERRAIRQFLSRETPFFTASPCVSSITSRTTLLTRPRCSTGNPPSFIENTGLFAAAAAVPTIHPTIQMPQRPRGGQDDVATASTAKPPVEYAIHEVRRCPNRALELPAGCW